MIDQLVPQGLFSIAEVYRLRVEAMHLYERCLTSGDDTSFIDFISAQVTQDPPRLSLLFGIAEDLEQRLLSLHAHHYDVQERVARALYEAYGTDFADLNATEPPADLGDVDAQLVREVINASSEAAASLQVDIQTTHRLQQLVQEWAEGIGSLAIRETWNSPLNGRPIARLH